MDQTFGPRAVKGSISNEQWNVARPLIERLYLAENRSFSYVADALKSEYGFYPTKRQYDRVVGSKWKLRKNTTIQQRRLAVEQLDSHQMDFDQAHPDVRGITRPLNASKLKRWKKNMGKVISLEVEDEPSTPEQMSIVPDCVIPELQYSEEMQQFDFWNCTRVHDSPNLTALFVTFGILDLGPSDVDIPMISLLEYSDPNLATDEHQYISPSDVFALHRPIKADRVHENTIYSSNLPTLPISSGDLIPTHVRHHPKPHEWNHTWYTDGLYQRELYPFKSVSHSRPVHTPKKVHLPLVVLENKFEKLVRLFPTNYHLILIAAAELRDECINQGKFVEIVPVLHKIVSVMEHEYGVDHPKTLNARLDLIDNLHCRKEWQDAADQHRHIHKKILVNYSLNYRLFTKSLALLAEQADHDEKYERAERLRRQVLQINLNVYGVKHRDTLKAMDTLALTWTEKGSWALAEKLLRVTTQVHHHLPNLSAGQVWRGLMMLAGCLLAQKIYPQVHVLVQRASAYRKRSIGHADRAEYDRTVGRLVVLLRKLPSAVPLQ